MGPQVASCFPDSARKALLTTKTKPPQTNPQMAIMVTQVAVVMTSPRVWPDGVRVRKRPTPWARDGTWISGRCRLGRSGSTTSPGEHHLDAVRGDENAVVSGRRLDHRGHRKGRRNVRHGQLEPKQSAFIWLAPWV